MSFLRSSRPVSHRPAHRPSSGSNGPPPVKKVIEKPSSQPAPGTYTDYKLVSTSRDVLHHVMKFHGNKDVNPALFSAPVKLHRKRNENSHYYRSYNYYNNKYNNNNNNNNANSSNNQAGASGAAAGAAGGDDKRAGAAGGPSAPTTGADTSLIAPYGGGVRNKQMLFKKRTRQIYIANEEERKKKEIEAAPWVVEDYDSQNNWTGQLEGGQHANYVLFVFSDDGFKVVPADKWYKFSPKIQYTTLTAEEAEEQYQKASKQSNSSIRWLMRSKNSANKNEDEEGGEEDADGDQFMAVDHDEETGYDEDEAKERKRKRGKHGDVDEMDFDEVWQDDEEAPSEMPGFDDDAKDDPRRKHGPQMDSDEDEDEEDGKRLHDSGKEIKKALLKLEKNKVYASDDEKDPYASDKDSSDSDLDEIDKEKEIKKEEEMSALAQDTKSKKKGPAIAKGSPLIPKKTGATKANTASKPTTKALKGKVPMPAPRNTSQLNGKGSAASSSASLKAGSSASTTSSPGAASRADSPGIQDKKRRKIESGSSEAAARPAQAGVAPPGSPPSDDSMLITEKEVVSLLKSRPQMTTRDLIIDLKKKLKKEPRNKGILATIVKRVASSQDGVLNLKEGF